MSYITNAHVGVVCCEKEGRAEKSVMFETAWHVFER